jgi:hypothetical protein
MDNNWRFIFGLVSLSILNQTKLSESVSKEANFVEILCHIVGVSKHQSGTEGGRYVIAAIMD